MAREYKYDIMKTIKDRWSPRAFSEEKIPRDEILAVVEAASFAPSCFNEQPWRFIIADNPQKLEKMQGIISKGNQDWALRAPVLILLLSYKKFAEDDSNNRWNMFDTGTAWGFMSLEAQRRGLITHAMGGFSQRKAREVYDISDDYDVMAVVALGKMGDKSILSPKRQEKEFPQPRKSVEEIIIGS